MKKMFLLIVACSLVLAATAQETPKSSLEEIWKLDKVEIRQITQTGDTILLPYSQKTYANSTDCIYSVLKIRTANVSFMSDNEEYTVDCEWKNDKLFFMFTAPVEFTFKLLPENKILLWRQYKKYDIATRKATTLLIHLIYNKQ